MSLRVNCPADFRIRMNLFRAADGFFGYSIASVIPPDNRVCRTDIGYPVSGLPPRGRRAGEKTAKAPDGCARLYKPISICYNLSIIRAAVGSIQAGRLPGREDRMAKENIAVFFGGQSSEHEISCISATTIASAINPDRYNIFLVGITKEGRWLLTDTVDSIRDGSWKTKGIPCILSPDAVKKCLYVLQDGAYQEIPVNVIFPALHGMYGEDGTIQGLFELAQIPYVGCGVLASAAAMDKLFTKIIVNALGIRQAAYVPVYRKELGEIGEVCRRVEEKLSYPVFVKPSRAGSSCGVSRADDREGLKKALQLASRYDSKMLVEEMIHGRELECAVLGGKNVRAAGVGEIISAAEFYDYDAKYNNPESKTDVTPVLPEGAADEIRSDSVKIFNALDGRGLARVDFFLDDRGVVFNEINTLPGFTSISMYPMLWNYRGLDIRTLVQTLIDTAYTRDSD